MKYKVIAFTEYHDVVIANKNNIMCVSETSLNDDKGEDRLEDVHVGMILHDINLNDCDTYWWYSKKEWLRLSKLFKEIKM